MTFEVATQTRCNSERFIPPYALELHEEHKARRLRMLKASTFAEPKLLAEPKGQKLRREALKDFSERWEEARQLKAEQEREFWRIANAVTSFLRGAAEGIRGDPEKLRIVDIQRAVAKYYGVTVDDILSRRRTAVVIKPRQVAVYLARILTIRSLPEIGRFFGGRDHTTAWWSIHRIEAMIETDSVLRAEVEELRAALAPNGSPHV